MIIIHVCLLLVMYVGLALTPVLGELAVQSCAPFFFVGLISLCSGIGFVFWSYMVEQERFNYKDLLLCTFLGGTLVFIPNISEFWALQYASGAKAALIWSLAPFITALYSYCVMGQRLSLHKFLALLLGFAGFLVAVVGHDHQELSLYSWGSISLAEVMLLVGVTSVSYGWIVVQNAQRKQLSLSYLYGYAMLIASLFSFLLSYYVEAWHPFPVMSYQKTAILLSVIVLFCTMTCYAIYAYLLRFYTSTYISLAGFLEAFIAAVLQYLIIGTGVSLQLFLSLLVVTAALLWYLYLEVQHNSH